MSRVGSPLRKQGAVIFNQSSYVASTLSSISTFSNILLVYWNKPSISYESPVHKQFYKVISLCTL